MEGDRPTVDLVVPVHDEEAVLEANVGRLHAHLREHMDRPWRLTIADSASIDRTLDIARRLASDMTSVRVISVDRPGRGRALRAAWTTSEADVLAYTDVDLSTDLGALVPLVEAVASGEVDIAIGSRLAPGARVDRGLRREVISRTYNLLLRAIFAHSVRDAQCGFKAVRRDAVERLVPAVRDEEWFFDSELLLLAHRNGVAVREMPVNWSDDPDSSVRVVPTALADLRGIARVAVLFLRGGGRIPRRPREDGDGADAP